MVINILIALVIRKITDGQNDVAVHLGGSEPWELIVVRFNSLSRNSLPSRRSFLVLVEEKTAGVAIAVMTPNLIDELPGNGTRTHKIPDIAINKMPGKKIKYY